MSGTTFTYALTEAPPSVQLIQRSDGLVIPVDPGNANYAGFQASVSAAGAKPPPRVVVPLLVQDAVAVLANGLAITSTGTPALNGTYRCDGLAAIGLQAEMNAVGTAGTAFADGTASLSWADKAGTVHTFTVAQFRELMAAVNLFQAQVAQYAAGVIVSPPTG